MEFPVRLIFVYVFLALDFSVDFFFFFFCELLLCSKLCFLFFFMLPLLLPPPLFSFIYLLSDCVCVSAFIICCVFTCVRAVHSFYFVVLCFSLSFIKNSLIYSQLKRKNQQLYYLSFCVLVCSYLHGCCVCVVFFSVDYRWVSGCLYFIYSCVYVCALIIATAKKK